MSNMPIVPVAFKTENLKYAPTKNLILGSFGKLFNTFYFWPETSRNDIYMYMKIDMNFLGVFHG
jgi:hypothetical protein